MIGEHPGQPVRVVCALLSPLILMFGLYVVAHGHYGPGGGFAGGIIIGVGIILLRISLRGELAMRLLPPRVARLAVAAGVLGFVAVGVASLVTGGAFLDYAEVPAGLDAVDLRYLGILVVEVFVGLGVTGVMISLFDELVGEDR